MRRAILALCGMAAGFAGLALWLGLGRDLSAWVAGGMFLGVMGAGLPVLRYCCKRYLWEVWRCVLLGVGLGVLCALPFAGGPFGFGFLLLILGLAGAALGLLFWLAAVWRNETLAYPKFLRFPCGTVYPVSRHAFDRRNVLQSK